VAKAKPTRLNRVKDEHAPLVARFRADGDRSESLLHCGPQLFGAGPLGPASLAVDRVVGEPRTKRGARGVDGKKLGRLLRAFGLLRDPPVRDGEEGPKGRLPAPRVSDSSSIRRQSFQNPTKTIEVLCCDTRPFPIEEILCV
jgi:hypothetical protein